MNYRDFFLIESWKNYTVSTNPEILLYDFYVVSYLTTLPLGPAQKGFSGTLIGREANEIKLDIKNAEDKLLPVLRDKLSEALFIAICAEIRHLTDKNQNYKDYENNQLLKKYLRNYGMFRDDSIPDEFKPKRNVDRPQQEPSNTGYLLSFKAATKAIRDTGNTRVQFATLCAELFRNMKWPPMYGGKKWAEIAEAYVLLNKSPQTNAQLQVAIDHAYDLQHNTGTVLNKVKTYYNKGDISWLKKALDFKANLKNVYSLLPKCSSDMRKLALEAFKTAGIKKETLETTVAGDAIKSKSGSIGIKFKVGDLINFNMGFGAIEFEGKVIALSKSNDANVSVEITKIIKKPTKKDVLASDWKVGMEMSIPKAFVTKVGVNDKEDLIQYSKLGQSSIVEPDGTIKYNIGDLIKYKAGSGTDTIELYGYITKANAIDNNNSVINITKIITLPQTPSAVAHDWKVGQPVIVHKAYMTKLGEKSTFEDTAEFKVGDLVHYVNDSNGNDVEGIIDSVDQLGYYNIKITKANKLAANVKIGDIVASSAKYMTKLGEKSPFKIGEFKVGDLIHYVNNESGNDVEGVIDGAESWGYYKIKITKVNKLDSNPNWKIGDEVLLSGQHMTNITDGGLKIGDVGTLNIDGNIYEVKLLSQSSDLSVEVFVVKPIDVKYNTTVRVGKNILVGIEHFKKEFKSYSATNEKPATKEEKFEVGDIVTFVSQNAKYEGVVIQKVTNSTLRVKVQKILDSKDANKSLLYRIGAEVTMAQSFFKKKEYI